MKPKKLRINKNLNLVFSVINSDKRITTTDIALIYALIIYYVKGRSGDYFQVSRRGLMEISKISSTRTYHKSINNLINFGYIKYVPSYHPKLGSKVSLLMVLSKGAHLE
ncbi:hypothetical protein [Pedobacter sp. R-06]|uniref:hypothetical protein n=1 Tax=Pedobacter sp. R-06 TaxID=3404051 RepID=UPI003CE997C7